MAPEERIFSGGTEKAVAEAFSKTVAKNYTHHLEFWQATAMDDREEYAQWQYKIATEPKIVAENALKKLLKIMEDPKKYRRYYKKRWLFAGKNVISITKKSGFYDDLLPGNDISHSVAINVEYLIYRGSNVIAQKIYPYRINFYKL